MYAGALVLVIEVLRNTTGAGKDLGILDMANTGGQIVAVVVMACIFPIKSAG